MITVLKLLAWFLVGFGCGFIGRGLGWTPTQCFIAFLMIYISAQLMRDPPDETQ